MTKNTKTSSSRSVLELTYEEARLYFLKSESYCNFDLPVYFDFTVLLERISNKLNNSELSDFVKEKQKPRDYEGVNYRILNNKDGKYSWRPLQLIHPALYVSLVHKITTKENWELIYNRFAFFKKNSKIECISLPRESQTNNSDKAEQISNWWQQIEQRSLEMALDYEYLTHTDITDCYGAIYTHSIAWALHNKYHMKQKENRRDKFLLGNIIDNYLQDMSYGQTNGIPQGSTLMDFIAEMVLGYSDYLLSKKIPKSIVNYKIIRYRDDYRIFTDNPSDGQHIVKYLTEVMIGLGLKLSAEKTKTDSDVIDSSIKSDKRYWIRQKQKETNVQKHLLIIHELAKQYPNSGSLTVALNDFYLRLRKIKKIKENIMPLISISVDIAYKNPRTYQYIAAILSYLLSQVRCKKQKVVILEKIIRKFQNIPNTGYLLIWLQRVVLGIIESGIRVDIPFEESICQLVDKNNVSLWANSWLKNGMSILINLEQIIKRENIKKLPEVIDKKEIELFKSVSNSDVY